MDSDCYICPTCGAEVKVGVACPGCGGGTRKRKRKKKARTPPRRRSWEQDEAHDGLDLPDEEFDYEDFVAREFGHRTSKAIRIRWYWVVTAVALVGALLVLLLGGWW
ncbi:MAG: hypothetical protein MK194_04155 [Roseibacillus sp.]|nr:hypothetical protein [Roseibacillus sp.]